jgi:hypothetical protein
MPAARSNVGSAYAIELGTHDRDFTTVVGLVIREPLG